MFELSILSENELPFPLESSKNFTLCTTMDLLSFQLNDNTIWIYRPGNERVWDVEMGESELESKPESEILSQPIESLTWRPDGKLFALINEKGGIELFDSQNGKGILNLQLNVKVQCCGWFKRELNLNDDDQEGEFEQLFDVDIVKALPLLNGTSDGKVVIDDDLIHCDGSLLDFLIIGSEGGFISLIFAGIFTIENYQVPQLKGKYSNLLSIYSNIDLTSHYILLEDMSGLSIIKLDTKFVEIYNKKLSNVSLTCSKLFGLLNYIKTSIIDLNNEYKPYIDYTTRIIELLRGEMKENEENVDTASSINTDPIYDLYDLLLTGSLSDATKRWLTDYLGDRGIKRWTKLGKQYFEKARKLIFHDLIPSLQHLSIYLSNLDGLANWGKNELGLKTEEIKACIEMASIFLKNCYKIMIQLNEDQKNFESMLNWLNNILVEITTDDKVKLEIKTKEIIKFLWLISSKLDQSSNNDLFLEYHENLDKNLNQVFNNIKDDIKLNMSSDLMTNITDHGANSTDLKIFNSTFGHLLIIKSAYIEFAKFLLTDLTYKTIIVQFNKVYKNLSIKKIEGLLINESTIIMLLSFEKFTDLLIVKIPGFGTHKKTTIELNESIVLQKHCFSHNSFFPSYITTNSSRRVCCILDSNKKNYMLLKY